MGDKEKKKGRLRTWGSKKVGRFLRWQVTVACAVIVCAVGGAGLFAWHETPGFCGAICHASMDGYVPTYEAEPGQAAVDKWGNEVKDASSMLAATHREYGELTCMSCHHPSMEEQMTEGVLFVSGNYYSPLGERDLTDLVHYRDVDDDTELCLNEECHNMTKEDLTKATSSMARNPHSWHHFEYTCTDCHKSHRSSIMVCTDCHDDAEVPDSWLSAQESKELDTIYGAYERES